MLRICWTARQTNVSIVNELDEPIRLSVLCERRKLGHYGHIMRRKDGNLEKDIPFDKASGRRERGRSPTRWSDTMRARMGSVVGAAKEAQDPVRWHKFIGAVGSFATDLMMIFGPPVLSFCLRPWFRVRYL